MVFSLLAANACPLIDTSYISQLKCLRKTLYIITGAFCFFATIYTIYTRLRKGSLFFPDVSFFDREPVGNLTSRLGANCQKLSHNFKQFTFDSTEHSSS
ncbi:hypothetical protein Hanom_Chr11g01056101 [Helianthus anomalus]